MRPTGTALATVLSAALLPALTAPQDDGAAAAAVFRGDQAATIPWRNIGPANMAGRLTDIEVVADQTTTWYVGSASGGVWRTRNAGTTWEPLFQHQPTSSIGDVAVAPTNPDIVWVGTGEENARNSVSWGDGVYRSTDGGDTWTHRGLGKTFQIGHIAIHPTDPDTVYVAALGRLWGNSPDRGVFRTRDGGDTWEKVLFVDDKTGCIDVRIDPQHPEIVYAAMYERRRDEFDSNDPAVRFGEGAGLFRSDDGGDTWQQLTTGLPTCSWGRTGLSLLASNPDTVFAVIETERSGWATGTEKDDPGADARVSSRSMGFRGANSDQGARLRSVTSDGPAAKAGLAEGDVIVRWGEAEIASYSALLRAMRDNKAGEKIAVGVVRGEEKLTLELELAGPTDRRPGSAYMGITGEDGENGALLTEIVEDGPAAKAGFKPNDVVVQIGERKIGSYNDMISVLRRARAEDQVAVTVQREDEKVALQLTYGARPTGGGGAETAGGPFAGRLGGQRANVQDEQGEAGFETGGIFRSDDRGETWKRINSLTERPFYYSILAVDPRDDQKLYHCGTAFYASDDGGQTFEGANREIHVDFHAVWVDPDDSDHLLLGGDGGLHETWDRCRSWEVLNNFPIGQFYHVDVDNSVPYRVYGGLQDNGTWGGPSRTRDSAGGITADDWVQIYGGDGFGARIDPTDSTVVYATSQLGNIGRVDLRSGATARVDRPRGSSFNWDTPFFLSPHNPHILYFAGDHAFRSLDRGRHSEQLTATTLGLTERGTATAMAESPRRPGLLYLGTDDGALWRSLDNGTSWQEIHGKVLDMPGPRYVSSIHPSRFADERVYVTFEGHRSDDFDTHVYVSEDAGSTWSSLLADLPDEPCHVIREDPGNENLLFLGTEFACYVSFDRGQSWLPLGADLPTVPVRDLAIQDRDTDLVAATHGRGLWILDIAPLRQLTAEVAAQPVHLFAPDPATLWQMQRRYRMGSKRWAAANPPYGAPLYVWLEQAPAQKPVITIHDVTGKQIAAVEGKARAGLQRLVWDARLDPATTDDGAEQEPREGRGRRRRRGPPAAPGAYSARLQIEGAEAQIQPLLLEADPTPGAAAGVGAAATPSNQSQR